MRIFAVTMLAALACGCVRRELTVTSEPPGALVYINSQEAGRTPFTTSFTWYGTYDVVAVADGQMPLHTKKRIVAPWWQWVPFDLAAEFAPWGPVDRKSIHLELQPEPADASEGLLARASEMRAAANESRP